jgi:hypothetical protein
LLPETFLALRVQDILLVNRANDYSLRFLVAFQLVRQPPSGKLEADADVVPVTWMVDIGAAYALAGNTNILLALGKVQQELESYFRSMLDRLTREHARARGGEVDDINGDGFLFLNADVSEAGGERRPEIRAGKLAALVLRERVHSDVDTGQVELPVLVLLVKGDNPAEIEHAEPAFRLEVAGKGFALLEEDMRVNEEVVFPRLAPSDFDAFSAYREIKERISALNNGCNVPCYSGTPLGRKVLKMGV